MHTIDIRYAHKSYILEFASSPVRETKSTAGYTFVDRFKISSRKIRLIPYHEQLEIPNLIELGWMIFVLVWDENFKLMYS